MPTNHVIIRAGFTLSWFLAFWYFRNIFLPNRHTGEDQKKSYLSAVPLALSHVLNLSLVIALRS